MSEQSIVNSPTHNPEWLLFDINLQQSQIQWLHLSAAQRKQFPFMDRRILKGDFKRLGTTLDTLSNTPLKIPNCQWIFHAGHCGSTLLAQILGDRPEVNALREPQVLRTLSDLKRDTQVPWHRLNVTQWQQWFHNSMAYLARPNQAGQQHSLLKATSQCNNLIESVIDLPGQQKVLLLCVKLPVYLATMLRSENHQLDINGFIQAHMQDLIKRLPELPVRIPDLSPAKKVAMTWLAHMLAFLEAKQNTPEQILLLDFENWLAAPEQQTERVVKHWSYQSVEQSSLNHWLGRYAKAPDQAYTPQHRSQSLERSYRENRVEINEAQEWLISLIQALELKPALLKDWV